MVALGANPGNPDDDPGKLRSSDIEQKLNLRRCSAAQAFCVPMTCGSTAGYLTPLLRSESHVEHHSTDTMRAVKAKRGTVDTLRLAMLDHTIVKTASLRFSATFPLHSAL